MNSIEFTGIDELLANLKRIGKNLKDVTPRALKAGAEPIRQAASQIAPYDPNSPGPHLKDNIIVSDVYTATLWDLETQMPSGNRLSAGDHSKDGDSYVEVGPQRGAVDKFFYGKFHEFGTVKMKATPFVEPAFYAKRNECMENIAAVLREEIERSV